MHNDRLLLQGFTLEAYPMIRLLLIPLLLLSCGAPGEGDLVVWNNMRPEGRDVLDSLLVAYMEIHPDVTCSQVYYETEELRSNFQIASLGGSGPDLIYGPSDQVGPFSEMKLIAPIEDLLPQDFLNGFVDAGLVWRHGHLYQVSDRVGNHLHLLYNRNIITQPPETTDEMIELAKELTIDEDGDGRIDSYGLAWNFEEPYFFVPFLGGFGGWVMDDEAHPTLNNQETINAFQFMKDLKFTHKILPPESDYDTADALFKEGRTAMIINGPWSWAEYLDMGMDMGLALIPRVSETGKWAVPMVSPQGYSLNVNLEGARRQQTIDLLQYLTSDEAQLAFTRVMKTIPSRVKALEDSIVTKDDMLRISMKQAQVGKPMPVDPELRAIWDALRPNYQSVLNGTKSPEEAAEDAQREAEKMIKAMNQ
jgi:maltose-binding protein MalE